MKIIQWKGPGRPGGRRTRSFSTAPQIYSISATKARVGQSVSVTILGTNFRLCPAGSVPQVTFGGLPATNVVLVDSGTITCTSPVATEVGVVDVVVTVDCCS